MIRSIHASIYSSFGLSFCVFIWLAAFAALAEAQSASQIGQRIACQGGVAGRYECSDADLLSVLAPEDIGSTASCGLSIPRRVCLLNDVWGWTDEATGREFALVGREDATAFVEVTDPLNPIYVGQLLHNGSRANLWRDMKTYGHFAYIVAESTGGLGIQVFDLTELYAYEGTPITFKASALYNGFSSAHNIVINEQSGFAYVVGARGGTTCAGGLHMVSLENPRAPKFAGCFSHENTGRAGTGYTHDAHCVIYHGPDTDYQGHEICVGSNETHISIADVTDKSAPFAISKADYPYASYVHQGWLTDDHRYFIQNDEGDEKGSLSVNHTRTMIWDVIDLEDPVLLTEYLADGTSTDHNLYVKGSFVYQSNYIDGLHVLDISNVASPVEVAFFDTHPGDLGTFAGTWSNYPFFASGAVGVTSSVDGFFMIQPTAPGTFVSSEAVEEPERYVLTKAYPNPFVQHVTISVLVLEAQNIRIGLFDVLGREVQTLYEGYMGAGIEQQIEADLPNLPGGQYFYRILGERINVTRPLTRIN